MARRYSKWIKYSFIIMFAFLLAYFIHWTFAVDPRINSPPRLEEVEDIINQNQVTDEKANAFIDEALASVRVGMKVKKLDPLKLQNISVCQNFTIKGLKNIKRAGEARVYLRADKGYDVVTSIGFKRLTAICQVQIGWWFIEVVGTLNANISNLNIYGDISIPQGNGSHPVLNSFQVIQQEHFNMTFVGNNWAGKATEWLFPLFRVLLKQKLNSVLNNDVPTLIQSNLKDFKVTEDHLKTVKFPKNVGPRPTLPSLY